MAKAVLVLTLLLAATSALADDDPACTCRAPGRRVHVGDTLCLNTPDGPRRATCTMNENVTSWSFSNEGCEDAALCRPPAKGEEPKFSRRSS